MRDSPTASKFLCCFPSTDGRGQAIDNTLANVIVVLNALDNVKDLIPVAGVAVVVPILKTIVDQITKTRTNSKLAKELADSVRDLVNLIDNTVKDVRNKIDSMDKSIGNGREINFNQTQTNKPRTLDGAVERLKQKLEPLPKEIEKAREGNFVAKFWRSSENETRLGEVKDMIAAAMEAFRTEQTTIIAEIVQHVQAMVHDMRKDMKDDKYDEDLRALPRVNAAYDVIGESGYVEGTRTRIISGFCDWSKGLDEAQFLMLFGGAGTGKSTIAREVCGQLRRESRLGASYFFVRSDAGAVGSLQSVFPTIAFQLAYLQPRFRHHIAEAAREFMKLPSGSLKERMKTLVLNPMQKVKEDSSDGLMHPITIVLDALDEASGDLVNFLESLKELVESEPRLRILITTRPEAPIIRALKSGKFDALSMKTFINDIPKEDVDADIRRYLEVSFTKFWYRDKLLAAHPDAIARLTEKAEGLFIYARTVIEFLNCKTWELAVYRLDVIFCSTTDKTGMNALDLLYTTVMKNAHDEGSMQIESIRKRVIGVLAGLVILQDQVTIRILAPIMEVTEDEARRTVEELRSIISCSGQYFHKVVIRPLHLTLREFLANEERCMKEFYIDPRVHHLRVAKSCLRILNKELRRDMCHLGDAFKREITNLQTLVEENIPPHVQYACMYWSTHILENEPSYVDCEMRAPLQEFCEKKLLQWFEALSVMNRLDLAIHVLLRVHTWAKDLAEISTILEDGYRFVSRFYEAVNESPSQTYTSGLTFAPECSLADHYVDGQEGGIMVTPRDQLWTTCLKVMDCKSKRVLFSQDGQFLLLWSRWPSDGRGEIVVRDAATGNLLKAARREKEVVSSDIHPNSRSVAFLLEDGTVEEWDWTLEPQSTRVYALTEERGKLPLSKDGQVTYNDDGSRIICYWGSIEAIFVWSTDNHTRPTHRLPLSVEAICKKFSMDFDGIHMATLLTSRDETIVKWWNIETEDETSSLQINIRNVQEAVFAKNNKMLLTRHGMEKICVWNLEGDSWSLSTTINGIWRAFDVSRSGNLIASSSFTDISLWTGQSSEQLSIYQGHTTPIESLRLSPQGDRLVSTDRITLRIWDTTPKALSASSSDDARRLFDVRFSPNGEYIAVSAGKDVHVCDGSDGSLLAKLSGHTGTVESFAFSPAVSLLATYVRSDGVFLWAIDSKVTLPWTLSQSKSLANFSTLKFNVDGTLLAVFSPDANSFTVRIWNISSLPDGTRSDVGSLMLQSDPIQGRIPHYIKFTLDDSLTSVRPLYNDDSKVTIWNQKNGTSETCTFDKSVHSVSKPALGTKNNWIISTKTGKRILWLPPDRYGSYDIYENLLALGSFAGKFTLLDMSCFLTS